MNNHVRESQLPRYAMFVYPVDAGSGTYRVRIRKGWWGGPGKGVTGRDVLDERVTLGERPSSELEALAGVILGALRPEGSPRA